MSDGLGRDGRTGCEPARAGGQRSDELALGRLEQRIPQVEDQDDAQLVAVVVRFVLDRVVEDQRLADPPAALLEPDTVAAILGDDERQMRDDACVGLAVVRRAGGLRAA